MVRTNSICSRRPGPRRRSRSRTVAPLSPKHELRSSRDPPAPLGWGAGKMLVCFPPRWQSAASRLLFESRARCYRGFGPSPSTSFDILGLRGLGKFSRVLRVFRVRDSTDSRAIWGNVDTTPLNFHVYTAERIGFSGCRLCAVNVGPNLGSHLCFSVGEATAKPKPRAHRCNTVEDLPGNAVRSSFLSFTSPSLSKPITPPQFAFLHSLAYSATKNQI